MDATLNDYKLSCELLGHSMDVRAVATAGEEQIISGSRDKTMKLWKREGKAYVESITYQDHKNFVSCVFYLESSKWLVSGSNDSTICIYQEGGYVPILTLKGHESTVCSLAEGVEPQSLISGSWDKTARIWTIDQLGGVSSVVLRGHEAAVWAVATMPAVKKFITGSADKCIYYWNAKGDKLRMLKGHTDCVRGILTLSDTSLVSCANDAIIRYWNEDGECVQELSGHTNYIYAVAQQKGAADGSKIVVSCGEDSTLRMWDVAKGVELGDPIVHPAQSVWSVTCLSNGDIVTGSSDGVIRVFTKDSTRFASEEAQAAYLATVQARKAQMNEELGGIKKTDLPGPESLLTNGTREGQTKMVRHGDGSVKCYSWELGKWNLVGDITGASGGTEGSSGKVLHEGKEYDYVFSVDISDTEPAIKLPYNRGEDPWTVAQAFIHRHNLPQAYLDQVANFIVKNAKGTSTPMDTQTTATAAFADPFTGGARYMPGSSNSQFQPIGNADPFTGGSSYSTAASRSQPRVDVNFVKGSGLEKHFPISKYISFDTVDPGKVLDKLKEFNRTLTTENGQVAESVLEEVIKLTDPTPAFNSEAIEGLAHMLHWPKEVLFPVIDVLRLAIRDEDIFTLLQERSFLDTVLPQLNSSIPNQLMIIRCLTNMMNHQAGRQVVSELLPQLSASINTIKTGSANLQIAIATFYLNVSIMQTLAKAEGNMCHLATEGIVELLKWSTDLEACYRSMQAIGNITTTPFGQESAALVISVDYVMDKIRELTNTPQAGSFIKLNQLGTQLMSSF